MTHVLLNCFVVPLVSIDGVDNRHSSLRYSRTTHVDAIQRSEHSTDQGRRRKGIRRKVEVEVEMAMTRMSCVRCSTRDVVVVAVVAAVVAAVVPPAAAVEHIVDTGRILLFVVVVCE